MAKVNDSSGDSVVAFVEGRPSRDLRVEAQSFVAKYGSNPFSDYLLKYGRRPGRKEAATIGRLIGCRIHAADGTLQPQLGKSARAAAREARLAQQAESRVDMELNRALDAITFLAKNEIDPSPLIARISPVESVVVSENIEKAVLWLSRFANGWRNHVNIGNEEAQKSSTGISNRTERQGLCLVRSRDPGA